MSLPKERYGVWAGAPRGCAYDPERCAQPMFTEVWDHGRQCGNKRGWGTDGLFCYSHADKKERAPDKRSTDD